MENNPVNNVDPDGPDPRPTLPNGLKNIALSFSGGGFRAAGFSLGCFAYLDHIYCDGIPLSQLVKFISSASGGSFASMAIVHAQRCGHGFEEAYRNLFECLEGDKLLKEVLRILKDDKIWEEQRPDKSRNPINGFAIAYDGMLFKEDSFGVLWKKPPPGSVPEICVTTTDFTHGQQFRFQHDGTKDYKGVFGSSYLRIRTASDGEDEDEAKALRWEVIKKIKLGDILAASSCFPAGFEPIVYPDDFAWTSGDESLKIGELIDAVASKDSFVIPGKTPKTEGSHREYGFMDGGIVDNQAIGAFGFAEDRLISKQTRELQAESDEKKKEALKNADDSEKDSIAKQFERDRSLLKGYGYDLFAICDVSSNYTEEYTYSKPDKSSWFLKLSVLHYAGIDIALFLLGLYGVYDNRYPKISYLLIGATGLPIVIALYNLLSYSLKKLYRHFFGTQTPPNPVIRLFGKHIWYFVKLPLYSLLTLIESRATSVVNLAVTLFLKKIRQDAYEGHLSDSLSKKKVGLFMKQAEAGQFLSVQNEPGLQEMLENQKSWNVNTINPTVYLLSTIHRGNLITSLNGEKWEKMNVKVQHGNLSELLFTILEPGIKISKVADIAANMGTTLWFDKSDVDAQMRASLIACGQFTICHSLLRFAYRFEDSSKAWMKFQEDLLNDWMKFQDDPYWLFNQIGIEFETKKIPLQNFSKARVR